MNKKQQQQQPNINLSLKDSDDEYTTSSANITNSTDYPQSSSQTAQTSTITQTSNLFDRISEFTKEINNETRVKTTNHIHFNDTQHLQSSSSSSSSSSCESTSDGENGNDDDIIEITESKRKHCILVRKSVKEVYGFDINGEKSIGHHFIGNVRPNTPASRSGLRKFDKIVRVNGIPSSDKNVNEIIQLIEEQVQRNPLKLDLIIMPVRLSQASRKRMSNEDDDIDADSDVLLDESIKKPKTMITASSSSPKSLSTNLLDHINSIDFQLDSLTISFYAPTHPHKTCGVPMIKILNEKAWQIRKELSSQGKFVSWKEISYFLLKLFKCNHVGQLGIQQVTNLECINELIRLQKRIDSYLIEYSLTISLSTLFEIEKSLCKYLQIETYASLYVGPLAQNQLIKDLFKFTSTTCVNSLPKVTYLDLFKYLRKYLDEHHLWTEKKHSVDHFEEFLREKLDSQVLPVRISSLPLMIGAIKNVKRIFNDSFKECELNFSIELKQLFENKYKIMYKTLNSRIDSHEADILTIKSPITIIQELFKVFEVIVCDGNSYYIIQDFLNLLKENEYLSNLFQLAIYLVKNESKLDLQLSTLNRLSTKKQFSNLVKRLFLILIKKLSNKQLIDYFDEFLHKRNLMLTYIDGKKEAKKHIFFNEDTSQIDEDTGFDNDQVDVLNETNHSDTSSKNKLITNNEILAIVNEKFEQIPNEVEKILQFLAKIEDEVTPYLDSNQSLLKFLVEQNIKLNKQESTSGNFTFKKFLFHHLKQVISNYDLNLTANKETIEFLICSNYGLTSITQFGFSSYDTFLREYSKYEGTSDCTLYQNAILYVPSSEMHQIEYDDLIELINKCPLLDNLYEFTQWTKVCMRKYGHLKDFLSRLQESHRVSILEINPSCALKLTNNCSFDRLNEAILDQDYYESAGQLVSLIAIKYKALKNSPLNLIAKQMSTSFEHLYASFKHDKSEFYRFIVKFICRLPIEFVCCVLFKLFLDPLIIIEGSSELVKDFIIKIASETDRSKEYFVKLANFCDLPEWLVEINQKIKKQQIPLARLPSPKSLQIEHEQQNIFNDAIVSHDELLSLQSSSDCKEHIDRIRQEKYGIGMNMTAQNEIMFRALKREISSCLETLSNELYNRDMHFVLELIQNADDNSYNVSEPYIKFIINTNSITLLNNEVGFSPKNVDAICAIGASTKGKHQHGYIGRKGIGFKSVFTVTNSPLIKSNGYNIKFDIANNPFGYILPIWLETNEINALDTLINAYASAQSSITCIHLPLKSLTERERHKSSSIAKSFNDIQSSLLLFLNRLRSIHVFNETTQIKCFYRRNDLNENLIEIHEKYEDTSGLVTQETKQWLIAKKTLQVPQQINKPNQNIHATDLCLAFPLYTNDQHSAMPKLDVYAYLPLRSFNFTFIIQADFQVPASRQDLMQNSEWNEWLVEEIPMLFVQSIELFIKYDDTLNGIKRYLRFIPVQNEIHGFFHHIPTSIITLLRQKSFLPVIGTCDLKKPIECILYCQEDKEGLLDSNKIEHYLNKYYVNPSLIENDKRLSKLLLHLGARHVSILDVITCMESIFSQSKENYECKTLAQWILLLKQFITKSKDFSNDDDNIKFLLKRLYILPLINNKNNLTCLNDHKNVYFQVQSRQSHDLIDFDLNFINLNVFDTKIRTEIIEFFEYLNVKSIDSKQVIEDFVVKEFENSQISMSCPKKHVKLVLYLFNYFMLTKKDPELFDNDDKILLEKLERCIVFLTEDEKLVQSGEIYLSESYQGKFNFKKMFPGFEKFKFISSTYLSESLKLYKKDLNRDSLIGKWKKFFNLFKISDIFDIKQIKEEIRMNHDLHNPMNPSEKVTLVDYKCELFEFYIEKIEKLGKLEFEENEINDDLTCLIIALQNLYEIFHRNWSKIDDFGVKLQDLKYKRLNETFTSQPSSFYHCLRNSYWCVSMVKSFSLSSGHVIANKCMKFSQPGEVLLNKDCLKKCYGEHNIPYMLKSDTNEDIRFYSDLGIKHMFVLESFMEHFKWLLSQSIEYFTSIEQISNVYQIIAYQLDNETYYNLVNNYPILFIPRKNIHLNEIFYGQWTSSKGQSRVYLKDKKDIFTKYHEFNSLIFLDTIYQKNDKILEIFTNRFNISKYPNSNDYIELLEIICTNCLIEKLVFEDCLPDIYAIFEILADLNDDIKDKLNGKRIFPCVSNRFCSLDDQIILSDNHALAKKLSNKLNFLILFKNDSQNYLKLSNLSEKLNKFFSLQCGMKFTSNVMISEHKLDKLDRDTDELKIKLNKLLLFIQPFLYNKLNFTYKELIKHDNIQENLMNLEIKACKRISIVYVYKYNSIIREEIDAKSYLNKHKDKHWQLFINENYLTSEKEQFKAFAKLFVQNETQERALVNYLTLISDYTKSPLTEDDKNEIENENDFKLELPKTEELWSIESLQVADVVHFQTSTPRASISQSSLQTVQMSTIYEEPPLETPRIDLSRFLSNTSPSVKYSNKFEYSRDHMSTHNANEIEDISIDTKFSAHTLNELQLLKLNSINEQSDYRNKIGRWGEKFVYEMLLRKYENEIRKSLVKIEWINRESESGHPYDLKVISYDEENYWDTKSEVFIEVKSTTKPYSTTTKDYFPVSINEITFALSKPNNFEIYRLFNAGNEKLDLVKIKRIKNIQKNLSTHSVNLLMIT